MILVNLGMPLRTATIAVVETVKLQVCMLRNVFGGRNVGVCYFS